MFRNVYLKFAKRDLKYSQHNQTYREVPHEVMYMLINLVLLTILHLYIKGFF